jgi:fatty-acyl-CoA synthase
VTTAAATRPNDGSLIIEALEHYRTAEAFLFGDRRVASAEAADTTARFVQGLRALGSRRGCGVGVLSPHAPEVLMVRRQTANCAGSKR